MGSIFRAKLLMDLVAPPPLLCFGLLAANDGVCSFACFPMADAVIGYWLYAVASARRLRVTLVNSPLGVQHLPWPSWSFGNRSIVLHGLKEASSPFWAHAARSSSGPFEPTARTCDSCAAMGWSTWPGSVVHAWRCCGERVLVPRRNATGARRRGGRSQKHAHPPRHRPRGV